MEKTVNNFYGDELAYTVWKSKYAQESEIGWEDTVNRILKRIYDGILEYKRRITLVSFNNLSEEGKNFFSMDDEAIYNTLKELLLSRQIIPGGSVLATLGTNKLESLSNCFVIDGPNDSYEDILRARNEQVQLMKRRGGVGYDLSKLRPRGAVVKNAAATATGAASFLEVNSAITKEVSQGGRRGALMQTLDRKSVV
jgi:ribonucleoside-diphosphate reductase alpha chain